MILVEAELPRFQAWGASHVVALAIFALLSLVLVRRGRAHRRAGDHPRARRISRALAVYTTWGRGLAPTWGGYRGTMLITAIWAFTVFGFNSIAGTNYGYLNRKPDATTILDLVGPWPLCVILEIGLVAIVWAALTSPFERRQGRDERV